MSNALGTTDRSHMPPNRRAWIAGAHFANMSFSVAFARDRKISV